MRARCAASSTCWSCRGWSWSTADGDADRVNDVSFHRRQDGRVAELAYSVEGEELGRGALRRARGVHAGRLDGLQPRERRSGAGLGRGGLVVSFIAPHTLTARALVVAPGDVLVVTNRSREEVDVSTDGRTVCALAPEASMRIAFRQRQALLAQVPGASFYHRLREKFGRLAY